MEQQTQQLTQLRGDILLATKERQKLQDEIDQLQLTRIRVLRETEQKNEGNPQIIELNKRIRELESELQTVKQQKQSTSVNTSGYPVNEDEVLLAKRKDKLLNEIEKLEETRKTSFKQTNHEIQEKRKDLEFLTKEGKRLGALSRLYSKSVEELMEKITELKAEEVRLIKEAREKVATVHQEAENRIRAVKDREDNVDAEKEAVKAREKNASNTLLQAQRIQKQNEEDAERLKYDEAEFAKKQAIANETLAKQKELLEDIDRQIIGKNMQVQVLDFRIKIKTEKAEEIGKEAERQLLEANRLIKEYRRKDALRRKKEGELRIRERKLTDDQQSLKRAYDEIVKKGGQING